VEGFLILLILIFLPLILFIGAKNKFGGGKYNNKK